jgi:argininosuccinate lyase
LNYGKSRNDQVATALRMALRDSLLGLGDKILGLQATIVSQALSHARDVMPGYTHLQRAQPITIGHHLLAYVESLSRDLSRLFECYQRVNKSPMGAGALASSGLSLDRSKLASLLGFDGIVENTMDAVSSRDFAIEAIYICAQLMTDISRLAEELVIWTTKEFSFAEVSDDFAASSSIMPQKKNAVVAEIARARASQVLGDLVASLGIVKALPQSYNLDLQELSYNLWDSLDKTDETLKVMETMMKKLSFNTDSTADAVSKDESIFATEVADYLVRKHHVPFREAHQRVGALMKRAYEKGRYLGAFSSLGEKEIEEQLGVPLSRQEISKLTDPLAVLSQRKGSGSPNPVLVVRACRAWGRILARERVRLEKLSSELEAARRTMTKQVQQITSSSRKTTGNLSGVIAVDG